MPQQTSPVLRLNLDKTDDLLDFICKVGRELIAQRREERHLYEAPEVWRTYKAAYQLKAASQLLSDMQLATWDISRAYERDNHGLFDPRAFEAALRSLEVFCE